MKNLSSYFKNAKAYVWKEKFAVAKVKKPPAGAFVVIKDKKETTVIIAQSRLKQKDSLEIEKDWRIITFDAVLPFGLVGFLAKISSALAEEKISIFAVSAYSTDHILVKGKDLAKATKKLEKLGFKVKVK